jgi:hypothetical protein
MQVARVYMQTGSTSSSSRHSVLLRTNLFVLDKTHREVLLALHQHVTVVLTTFLLYHVLVSKAPVVGCSRLRFVLLLTERLHPL